MFPLGVVNQQTLSGSTLLDDLVSWWTLDETSGTRADSHGSNDLTDNNTVLYDTGKQNNAAAFVRAASEYLSLTPTGGTEGSDRDFTVAAWVYFTSLPQSAGIMRVAQIGAEAAATTDWMLYYETSTNRLQFVIGDGGTWRIVNANTFGAISTGTWYLLIGEYDASASQMAISVNGGTKDALGSIGTPNTVASAYFQIGKYANSSAYNLDGRVDEAAFWDRLLTSAEITELYNSGDGLAYADLDG